MPPVPTATEDDDLAAAVHCVLATLSDLRSSAAMPDVLLSRIMLVRWLRQELGAVETLLTDAAARTPGSGTTGTVIVAEGR